MAGVGLLCCAGPVRATRWRGGLGARSGLGWFFGQSPENEVPVDDRAGELNDFAVADVGLVAQHREGGVLVDAVALHQDPLGPLDCRATLERSVERVVFGVAAQRDVDRTLVVLSIGVIA